MTFPSRAGVCVAIVALLTATAAYAVPIEILYSDGPAEGFFDAALGVQRRAAFEHAIEQWAGVLAGTVPVVVDAAMDPLGGSGGDAVLASTATITVHRNFGGAVPDTWYGAALANQLLGSDINGVEMPEISIVFNSDVDGPEALGSLGWYYGLDAQPGSDFDFVSIALHELGHGLGFFEMVNATTGGWLNGYDPGIFDRMLFRPGVGALVEMRPAERLAAIISNQLLWDGPSVVAFAGQPAPVFAPDPFRQGASIGHWDPALTPDEVIEPFYTGAVHDLGLLLPAMMDIGWTLAVDTPTPRAAPATPTPTLPPRSTPTASTAPAQPRVRAYATNFDDGTVSVIDTEANLVIATVAVGDGPAGIAAAPDGRHVYIANFQSGTLAVLGTRTNRIVDTVSVGDSANGIAVTSDGRYAVVTDTAGDQTVIVSTAPLRVTDRVASPPQPSGVALDADGRLAFVTNYGRAVVTMVDIDSRLRRALIPLDAGGLLGIAIAPQVQRAYVATSEQRKLIPFNLDTLSPRLSFFPFDGVQRPEAVAVSPRGDRVYVSGYDPATGDGQLSEIDTATDQRVWLYVVGRVPEAVALSNDGRFIYVANTGSDTVSVVNPQSPLSVRTISVGRAPMGIAVTNVPPSCDGDCDDSGAVSVDELVRAVGLALQGSDVVTCEAVDADGSGTVTVDELVRAVDRSLRGC